MIRTSEPLLAEPFPLSCSAAEKPVEKPVENRLSQCKHRHFDVSLVILHPQRKSLICNDLQLSP